MAELYMPFLCSHLMSQAHLMPQTRPPLCNPTCRGFGNSESFMVENNAQCYSHKISAPCGVSYKLAALTLCRRYLSFVRSVLLCQESTASHLPM